MGVLKAILISCLVLGWASAAAVEIEKGWLTLQVKTGDNTEEHKVEYSGRVKEEVTLTQSSKINIRAKVSIIPGRSLFQSMILSPNSSHSDSDTLSMTTSPNPSWLPGTTKMAISMP